RRALPAVLHPELRCANPVLPGLARRTWMAGGTGVARSLAWPRGLGWPALLVCPALGSPPLLWHDHCGRRAGDLDHGGRHGRRPTSPRSQSLLVLGRSLRPTRLLGLLLLDDERGHRAR